MDATSVDSDVRPISRDATGGNVEGVAEPPGRAGVSRWRWLPALVPGSLMLVLGLIGVTRPVLSWDEVATADVAGRPVGQIWHTAQNIDAVFTPYYLLMHLWTSVAGATDLTLRLPSVVAMAGVAAMTGELGRRMFGPVAGTVGALFLCLIPNASRYAAEARPYAFASFFAVLALVLLLRTLRRPGAAGWIGYGVVVLFMGLSHVIALTTLAAHVPLLLARRRHAGFRRTAARWALAAGVAIALLLPVLWLGLHQRDDQLGWVTTPTLGSLYKFPADVVGSVTGAWLLLGMALAALRRPPARNVLVLSMMALVPVAVLLALSVLGPSFWVSRYLLFVLPPLALVAAAGLVQPLPRPAGRRGAVALGAVVLTALLVLGMAVLPDQQAVRGPTAKNGSDYRGAAAIIGREGRPGDVIVHGTRTRHLRPGLDHYLRDAPDRPRDVLVARSAGEVGKLRAEEYPNPWTRLRGTTRVWLLVYGRHADPTSGRRDLRATLRSEYRRSQVWHLNRTTLALYVRRDAAA
jgi:mannosyltransferase